MEFKKKYFGAFCVIVCCAVFTSGNTLSVPDTVDSSIVQTTHVLENDNLTLECNTTYQADLEDFYWIRNATDGTSSEFYATGWQLEFIHMTREASGIYICHALDNKTGENITMSAAKVDVRCSPRPDPGSNPRYLYRSSVGGNVSMTLNIKADPVRTYTWSRDDKKPFGNVAVEEDPSGTTLTIYDVSINDFGNYTLTMNNTMCSYDAQFTLQAYGYPVSPHNVRASNITDDSVDLSWTSGYDMGSHQKFLVMKWIGDAYMQISRDILEPYKNGGIGQNWSFHLSGLKSDTTYQFEIMAENAENFSFSNPVIFNTTFSAPPSTTSTTSTLSPVTAQTSSNTATLVGCSVAAVVVLVSAVAISFVIYRRRQHSQFTVDAKFSTSISGIGSFVVEKS